jgi:WD40 repeat protein
MHSICMPHQVTRFAPIDRKPVLSTGAQRVGGAAKDGGPSRPGMASQLTGYDTPPGPRVVVGTHNGKIAIVDPEAGTVLHLLEGHRSIIVQILVFRRDSGEEMILTCADEDPNIVAWDAESGAMVYQLPRAHNSRVASLEVYRYCRTMKMHTE